MFVGCIFPDYVTLIYLFSDLIIGMDMDSLENSSTRKEGMKTQGDYSGLTEWELGNDDVIGFFYNKSLNEFASSCTLFYIYKASRILSSVFRFSNQIITEKSKLG